MMFDTKYDSQRDFRQVKIHHNEKALKYQVQACIDMKRALAPTDPEMDTFSPSDEAKHIESYYIEQRE